MIMTTKNARTTTNNATTTTNDTNNVTNDAQTTTSRTTRALNAFAHDDKFERAIVDVDDTSKIIVRKTSTNVLRIDHSMCEHENTTNARNKCRARVARAMNERANDAK